MKAKQQAAKGPVDTGRNNRLPCTCTSPYQDKKYGKGIRVHTLGSKVSRCTVCGKEKA